MRSRTATTIRFPPDVQRWVDTQAGVRRMSRNDFILQLVQQGILAVTIDEKIARIEAAAVRDSVLVAVLREVLALRYLVCNATPDGAKHAAAANEFAEQWLAHFTDRRA